MLCSDVQYPIIGGQSYTLELVGCDMVAATQYSLFVYIRG